MENVLKNWNNFWNEVEHNNDIEITFYVRIDFSLFSLVCLITKFQCRLICWICMVFVIDKINATVRQFQSIVPLQWMLETDDLPILAENAIHKIKMDRKSHHFMAKLFDFKSKYVKSHNFGLNSQQKWTKNNNKYQLLARSYLLIHYLQQISFERNDTCEYVQFMRFIYLFLTIPFSTKPGRKTREYATSFKWKCCPARGWINRNEWIPYSCRTFLSYGYYQTKHFILIFASIFLFILFVKVPFKFFVWFFFKDDNNVTWWIKVLIF